jgi:hypothetical protein
MAGTEHEDAARSKKPATAPDTSGTSSVVRPGDRASTRPDTGEEAMVAPTKAARDKAYSDKLIEDGRKGITGPVAGQAIVDRAMKRLGTPGRIGAAMVSGAKTLSDVNNSTAAKVAHVGLTSVSGGNTHNLVENTSVAAELAGRTMIANDASVQQGLANAREADIAASDETKSTFAHFRNKTGGVSGLKAFQSAGKKIAKSTVLGAYQDLAMVKGPEEYSMDQTLGVKAPDAYTPGDTISKDDHLRGSTYGNIKRGVMNRDWGQHGKLTDDEKSSVTGLQGGLDAQTEERKKEFEARDKGSMSGAAKRLATEGDSVKLNDDEKQAREDIKSKRADAKTAAEARTEQLKKEVAAIRATKEAHRKTKGVGDDDKDLTDMRAALAAKRTELETHTANSKSSDDEFQGQIDDIHSRAKGGFTRAELADRASKEAEIKRIRTGATTHQEFSAEHDGNTVNRYGRVGGIEEMLKDPSKTETTVMGAIADKANSAFSEVSDTGAMLSGSAESSRRMMEQGKTTKAAIGSGIGMATEITRMAMPGVSHVAGVSHTAAAGIVEGFGTIGQNLTAPAAEEHRQRERAKAVLSGERRDQMRGVSYITTRKPGAEGASLAGGLASIATSALGIQGVRDGLSDAISGGPSVPAAPSTATTDSSPKAVPELSSTSSSSPEAHGMSMSDSVSKVTQPVASALSSAGSVLGGGIAGSGQAVSDGMKTVHDSVIAPAVAGITSAGHAVHSGLSSAHNYVENGLSSVVGDKKADGLLSDYANAGKEALQEHVVGSLTAAGDTVGNTVNTAANSVGTAVSSATNSVGSAISGPAATANSVLHPTSPSAAQVSLAKTIAKGNISSPKPAVGTTTDTVPKAPEKSSWWSRMTGWVGRKAKQAGNAIKRFGSRVRGWFGGSK